MCVVFVHLLLLATLAAPADDLARVGPDGVLRWERAGTEVALFGTNYYPAFYAENKEMTERGLDIRAVIESDLDQFVRLGFDLIRVHCFDREFTTPEGALVDNEHLRLLDHMIAEAKERGIYVALTPIAWWPTVGDIGGFSSKHTMAEMTTNPDVWAIEARYLHDFVAHVNPETGLSYGDDPVVVAFETINEPIPPPSTSDEVVTRFIDSQVEAIRSTGCTKPVFYNTWGGRHRALRASKADGSTFGWYPTGLGNGSSLITDCLGLVDRLADAHDPVLDGTPKMVYEFDCADVPTGELYPAMARSFRSAGIQIAAQFQYDATPCAPHNTWWVTHYLNLPYAPQRALAMMIAGKAFHRLPRGEEYGQHPTADRFGPFRVDHGTGLSEMADRDAFLYNADTETVPPAAEELTLVAGMGSSPLVRYEGTGAYFLDRLAPGVWRLELWPDAVWVADPFNPNHVSPEVSRVYWRSRRMEIRLPDLAQGFSASRVTGTNDVTLARDGAVALTPGVWVLSAPGATVPGDVSATFAAPPEQSLPPMASIRTAELLGEGLACPVRAEIAGPVDVAAARLQVGDSGQELPLTSVTPYRFEGTIPAELVSGRELSVRLAADLGGETLLFPGGQVQGAVAPLPDHEFLAFHDGDALPEVLQSPGTGGAGAVVPGGQAGSSALRLSAERFGAQGEWVGMRIPARGLPGVSGGQGAVVLHARRTTGRTRALEIGLVMDDGTGYGKVVALPTDWSEVAVPLASLTQLWKGGGPGLDLSRITEITVGMGPYTLGLPKDGPFGFELESVRLVPDEPEWRLPVQGRGEPFVLVEGGVPRNLRFQGQEGFASYETDGADPRRTAWGLEARSFPDGNCLGVSVSISSKTTGVAPLIEGYQTIHLRVRAAAAATTAVEMAFREMDGTAWGTDVPLAEEWQDIRLPITALRHFAHWGGTPEGRGGEGDHLRPGEAATFQLTFGAWLYPGRELDRHAVEVDYVALEP